MYQKTVPVDASFHPRVLIRLCLGRWTPNSFSIDKLENAEEEEEEAEATFFIAAAFATVYPKVRKRKEQLGDL